MQPLLTALPTLAVSAMYCLWHLTQIARIQRQKKLRERVAYMLWVVATELD
jgi:hypothetical protein